MKEAELRKHAICALCKGKIGDAKFPAFWVVTIERHGIDVKAVQRQQGLGMMITPALAMVMGPDEEMTMPLMDKLELTICENCCTTTTCVAALAEVKP